MQSNDKANEVSKVRQQISISIYSQNTQRCLQSEVYDVTSKQNSCYTFME